MALSDPDRKKPPVGELRETLKQMNAAWERLTKRKEFAPVLGWLRSTEITYGNVPGAVIPTFTWCSGFLRRGSSGIT